MRKENLLKSCDDYEKAAQEGIIMGYPRRFQKEISRISTAIIKAMCEEEKLTPFIAENAIRMAQEILETEIKNDIIL